MKKLAIILIAVSISLCFGQWKDLTVKEAVVAPPFKIASIGHWKWIDDTNELLFFDLKKYDNSMLKYHVDPNATAPSIFKCSLETGDTTLFLDGRNFIFDNQNLNLYDFIYHPESNKLILVADQIKIWRHSRSAVCYLYDIENGKIKKFAKGNRVRNVKYSPNGQSIAYVGSDNNLYVYSIINNNIEQITKDGSFEILNGHFGWVYEEEFGSYDAYRWSPDSKHIAFIREDQTNVKRFPMMDELFQYPKVYWHHYPKVGETNPILNIGIANAENGRTRWLNIASVEEMYHPRIKWLSEEQSTSGPQELIVTRINRHQNRLEFVKYPINSKNGDVFWKDESEAWISLTDDVFFLKDGSFITLSERSGYKHIYHFDSQGELIKQVTTGDWEVYDIVAFDEKSSIVCFRGKKDSVLEANIYAVNIDGSDFKRLSDKLGWHDIEFSPKFDFFIDTYSTANDPKDITLHRADGQKVRDLAITDREQFIDYGFSETKFIQIPTSDDGTLLNASITLPRDFDPDKKYPVIVYGYSGPGSQTVLNRRGRGYWDRYMNQEGYIYFSIDPRGTGGRGTDFKYLSYLDISKWVVKDQVEGAKYLRSLPYVDPDRIGIWGWSGGGTMTSLCMTLGAPHFQVGVAVAGNFDFRLYDTIWTERYMGLLEENFEGYHNASPVTYADLLEGKLLVIHGTMDDNVHLQHATLLMEKFVEADIHADFLTYAGRNHRINTGNAFYHLWTRVTNYFKEYL